MPGASDAAPSLFPSDAVYLDADSSVVDSPGVLMPTKPKKTSVNCAALSILERRVGDLEKDVTSMRTGMSSLSTEVSALRSIVKNMDDRTHRGEQLMLSMQLEQRRMSHTIERIAKHLNVPELAPKHD